MTTTIRDVLRHKGPDVWAVPATVSVRHAVEGMNVQRIGSVLVTREDGTVIGIFTERDVLQRVVAKGRDPGRTAVADVMTADPVTVSPYDDVYEVLRLMTETRHRHMPVFDGGRLRGLVSIGDLTDHALREMDGEVVELTHYIYGPAVEPADHERVLRFSRAQT